MLRVARWAWMPLLLAPIAPAGAQHHGHAAFASHHGHPGNGVSITAPPGYAIGAVSGGYLGYGYGFGSNFGYAFPVAPVLVAPVFLAPVIPFEQGGGGLMLPMPPAELLGQATPARTRPNPARARELTIIGDRSFRGGNLRRAEERYLLAAKADPTAPEPLIHLAQVALARKDYPAAARRVREAFDAAPGTGWLANFPDIQAIYAEPADFARHLAGLESHLQADPSDRDAWFVLGVEQYLSGRARQASDTFQRLTDRRPDAALAAFLEAATPPGRTQN